MSAPGRRRLAHALESLDERTRALLALSRLDGLTVAEIASLVSASPDQVTREIAIAERALKRAASLGTSRRQRA